MELASLRVGGIATKSFQDVTGKLVLEEDKLVVYATSLSPNIRLFDIPLGEITRILYVRGILPGLLSVPHIEIYLTPEAFSALNIGPGLRNPQNFMKNKLWYDCNEEKVESQKFVERVARQKEKLAK
jgi:hypothetical protein